MSSEPVHPTDLGTKTWSGLATSSSALLDQLAEDSPVRMFFDLAPVGMAVVGPQGRLLRANDALCQALGYGHDDLCELSLDALVHPDDMGEGGSLLPQAVHAAAEHEQVERTLMNANGQQVQALVKVGHLPGKTDSAPHLLVQVVDITEGVRLRQQLAHAATHDGLTGLPNRTVFMDALAEAIDGPDSQGGALMFIDVDQFKLVNDSLGHLAGDRLLVSLARRIERAIGPHHLVSRYGGDEFTVLMRGGGAHEAKAIALHLKQAIATPFQLDGQEIFCTASVGIAPLVPTYERPEEVLRDADIAMYRAKSRGRGRSVIFRAQMHRAAVDRLSLETDLRQAIARDEFLVYLQPIVRVGTGAIEGFEALLRWQHPERGLLAPAAFLRAAEDSGLIVPIGRMMFAKVCDVAARWQDAGDKDTYISVNFSLRELSDPRLVEHIESTLMRTGVDPSRIRLELTESAMMDDIDVAIERLEQLRRRGILLYVDDFGTGFSSYAHLHRFPIDTLKIDRAFVGRLAADDGQDGSAVVRSILSLAHSLGLSVIAEGVEQASHLNLLASMGCGLAQGYLFARPCTEIDATRLVLNRQPWTVERGWLGTSVPAEG